VIHVEPSVTMEQLVRAALAHGMVPKVVPPYRHATVGGAVSAVVMRRLYRRLLTRGPRPFFFFLLPTCPLLLLLSPLSPSPLIPLSHRSSQVMASTASSASHRHGSFHDSCSYLTVVLGNGTVVTCSKASTHGFITHTSWCVEASRLNPHSPPPFTSNPPKRRTAPSSSTRWAARTAPWALWRWPAWSASPRESLCGWPTPGSAAWRRARRGSGARVATTPTTASTKAGKGRGRGRRTVRGWLAGWLGFLGWGARSPLLFISIDARPATHHPPPSTIPHPLQPAQLLPPRGPTLWTPWCSTRRPCSASSSGPSAASWGPRRRASSSSSSRTTTRRPRS
jgi:hypothetical protein